MAVAHTRAAGSSAGQFGSAIPQDKQFEVIANVYEDSALLQLVDVRQMTSAVQDIVTAGTLNFPAGMGNVAEAGLKPVADGGLTSYQLVANKMAVFVIVSDELLAESAIDIVGFYQDAITQEMAKRVDTYGLLGGANTPFASNIAGAATTAGGAHVQVLGGTAAAPTNYLDRLTAAYNAIEADDFIPSGWLIQRVIKGALRANNDSTGRPLLTENFQGDIPDQLWGEPAYFLGRGVFPTSAVNSLRAVTGDFSQFVIGIREQLEFSLHSEGMVDLTGAGGAVGAANIVNLLQHNLKALKAEMRLGGVAISNLAFSRVNNAAT